MNNRLLRPTSGVHPEAAAWRSAVFANGGSVSGSTLIAVSTFCAAIDAAGIRDKFYRLNLFCGTGLNACLVPLYRGPSLSGTQYGNATDTNNGPFVSGDYAETGASGGLDGDGIGKYLNTGFNVSSLPAASDCHLSTYIRGTQSIAAPSGLIGAIFNGVNDRYRIALNSSTAGNYSTNCELGKANQIVVTRTNESDGLILLSRTSTTSLTLYGDDASIGTNVTSTAETLGDFPFYVFCRNSTLNLPVEFYNGVMAGYSIGGGMDSSDVSDYYTALQAFQTALGRNV
jgi:hypothetical protein